MIRNKLNKIVSEEKSLQKIENLGMMRDRISFFPKDLSWTLMTLLPCSTVGGATSIFPLREQSSAMRREPSLAVRCIKSFYFLTLQCFNAV